MKYGPVWTLLAMVVVYTASNGQPKADLPRNTTELQAKDAVTAYGPTSVTRAIKQDKKGNIWIASWEGIFRYDGQSFTNITRNVSSARFFSLLEDSKGNWWFGSIGSGVYRYDGQSFQEFTTKQGLLNNEVVCIYEDRKGSIWFGVNGGASRYDGHSFRNFRLNGDVLTEDRTGQSLADLRPPKFVNAILEDKTGKFWFGTREKAFVYDGKSFTILTNKGKPFTNVGTIIEIKKGLSGSAVTVFGAMTAVPLPISPKILFFMFTMIKKGPSGQAHLKSLLSKIVYFPVMRLSHCTTRSLL